MNEFRILLSPVCALFLLVVSAQARTLAVWPLEKDAAGALDGRCLVDPAGGLDVHVGSALMFEPSPLGWQRPPNPDGDGHWVELNNRVCAVNGQNGGGFAKLTRATPALFNAMAGLADFTVEGWIKLDQTLGRDEWKPFFLAQAGGANIMLSLRRTRKKEEYKDEAANAEGYYYSLECYYRGGATDNSPGGDTILWEIREADFGAFMEGFHHLAVTLDHSNAKQTKMHCYVDGDEQMPGGVQVAKFSSTDNDDFVLYLGGRQTDSLKARFDYWRISDRVLAPSEFLRAGASGARIVEAPTSTVAYWKLDPDEQGVLDLRNAVGDYAHLRKNGFVSLPAMAGDAQWSEPNAFEPVWGGRDGSGSVTLQQPGMGLKAYDLGSRLMPTESFSVEGWYNPAQRDGAALFDTNAFGRVFAVADPDQVWSLQLRKKADGTRVFAIEAADDTTKAGGGALASGDFAAVLPRKDEWHHLRLAYDAAAGNGTWTLTVDETAAGSVANGRAPSYGGAVVGANVYLGSTTIPGTDGRTKSNPNTGLVHTVPARAANDWALGVYDSWSVSKDGTDIAVWPLDVKKTAGNLWVDGRDSKGAYPFTGTFYNNEFDNAVQTDDKATVTNPDRSAAFRGDASANGGSAVVGRNVNGKGFFFCDDPRVLALWGDGTKDMTFEYYQKRSVAMRDWEIVVSGDSENFGYGTLGLNFSQRASGFKLFMKAMNKEGDEAFADSLRVNDTTSWHHVALVRKYNPANRKVTASLYQDGVFCSSIEGVAKLHALTCVEFFARPSGGGLVGAVDEMRLSSAALEPSQFLCAPAEAPVTPAETSRKTLAYWELDNEGGNAVLKNAVVPALPLSGAAAGSAETATSAVKMRNPDATVPFDGVAATNHGSVVATTPLTGAAAGLELELTKPFTVEGWVKLFEPGEGGQDLFAVRNADGTGSWALRLVREGEAVRAAVAAVSPNAWTAFPVNGTFAADLAGRLGGWTHVALAYDSSAGLGRWRLFVDGRAGGTLDNALSAGTMPWGLQDVVLGPASGGAFDEWRVSRGVLAAEDLLFRRAPGLFIVIR